MPEDMARIHKVDGSTGQLIWTKNINNKIGFGITELDLLSSFYKIDFVERKKERKF